MPISCKCPSCGKRLKAPDSAAGKRAKCPQCGKPVRIPEQEVYEAEVADEANPDDEFGLQNFNAEDAVAGPAEDDRRPCPMCGEMILTTAAKCRYCGEVFDETLKRTEKKKKKASGEDATLTPGDYALCIVCSGIACIASIIYLIQGKPKAPKMLGLSFAMVIFWNVLFRVIEVILNQAKNG